MKAIISVEAKTQDGQDWSPLNESHIRYLIGEAMKRTGLRWEFVRIEE